MDENTLASRQVAFLIFVLLLGSAIVYTPEIGAGRDAWISRALASLAGLYILYAIINIQKAFPGMNIINISEKLVGKIPGTLLNLLLLWFAFINAALYLYDLIILLKLILPGIGRDVLYGVIVSMTAYVVYKNVNILGRLADLFSPFILMLTLLGFAILTGFADYTKVTPLAADWRPVAGAAFYGANWPFSALLLFSLFLSFTSDLSEKSKTLYIWFSVGTGLLIIQSIQVISVLGQEVTGLERYPLLAAFRIISYSNFQRIELFFFLIFILTGFFAVAIPYMALILGLEKTLHINPRRVLILPVGLLLITFVSYNFPSDIQYLSIAEAVLPFIHLPIVLLYTTVLLIAVKLYVRKTAVEE